MRMYAVKMSDRVIAVFASQVFDVALDEKNELSVWFRGIDITTAISLPEMSEFKQLMIETLKKDEKTHEAP